MNKSDLIGNLEGKLKNLSRKEIEVIVDTVFDRMTHALSDGGRIEIRGFGSFEVRTRDPRQGRNPKTGEEVPILPRRVLTFRASNVLKERINPA